MSPCSTLIWFCSLWLLFLCSAQEFPSFGFQRFDKDSNFHSQISLLGDARVDNGGAVLQLTESRNSSAGRAVYKEPIKLAKRNRIGTASFGTYFTFSLSPESGDGLAFLMVPGGFPLEGEKLGLSYELTERKIRAFAVEIDTKLDVEYGDLNANHVGIDVNSFVSVKVANASHAKLVLNSGEKFHCWIDYEATSKHIEVRLSKFGEMRPINPLLSCRIDLVDYFKNEEIWFGLTSSNSNSSQICKIYSWSFSLRPVPYWMHSQPLNPKSFSEYSQTVSMHKKSDCILRVLTAVIIGTGCGAIGAFAVLLLWTFFASRRQIMPEELVKVIVVDQALKESRK